MTPEILFENDDLVVLNKPAGMLVIPDRFDTTAMSLNRLLEEKLQQKIWVVHRLDRDTSGAICFAKNEQAHKYMSNVFQEHKVGKFYLGLVHGRVTPEEGTIEKAIVEHPTIKGKMVTAKKGKASVTDYKVVKQWPLHSLVQFQIHTGRTHQIRVHMLSIGHPIVADETYGDGKPFLLSGIKKKYRLSEHDDVERPLLSRLALHSSRIVFTTETGEEVDVEAPLPKDMRACIAQLDKWSKAG
ncbi:MAG: RluA family pseudouridine synthase [Sphingobacteriales bacterium]|nr:MAG: RluA family pseudouridine synthase [Sphingobacteriales bacterium]